MALRVSTISGEKNFTDYHRALTFHEKEIHQLRTNAQNLDQERNQLRQLLECHNHELILSTNDSTSLTKEIQILSRENSRIAGEIGEAKKKLDAALMRADRAESTCKALELERKSVLANYASAMNELRLFQEGNEELYRTRAQLCDDLQICQAENRRVREQFMNMQQGARQHSSNMVEFQRQLNLI